MWNRRKNRIADLEARNAHLLRELEKLRGQADPDAAPDPANAATIERLRTELRRTKATLRETERQLAGARAARAAAVVRCGQKIAERNRYKAAWQSARLRARPGQPVRDELWRLLDWCFWGAGMGDVLREPLADAMTAAISGGQREAALRIMKWWTEDRGRKPVGRWQYEDEKRRIARLRRACTRYRAELDQQQAVVRRQTEQLFDAIGYQPGDRALLGCAGCGGPDCVGHPAPAVTAGEVTAP